jgi:hypothetical protein
MNYPQNPGMKKFLSNIGAGLFAITMIAAVVLVFTGGIKYGAAIEPWIYDFSIFALVIGIPICLVLAIFRKTRLFSGWGIYYLSWPVGLWVWVACFLYAISVSMFWAIFGILAAGVGVIPVALIMIIVRGDWSSLKALLINLVILFVLRWIGVLIVSKAEDAQLSN